MNYKKALKLQGEPFSEEDFFATSFYFIVFPLIGIWIWIIVLMIKNM